MVREHDIISVKAIFSDLHTASMNLIEKSKEQGVDIKELRKEYNDSFQKCMEKLNDLVVKPCPFCQNQDISLVENEGAFDIRCSTPDCFLEQGGGWALDSEQEILELWNKRS